MNKKYKLAFATGSRADYGIVREYLFKLNKCPVTDLSVLVTGALLQKEFGYQADLINADGFDIAAKFPLPLDTLDNKNILQAMAVALNSFGEYFDKNKYDLLIILGDRYEMLPVAISAAIYRIPILHIHGGEATYGNYDEFIRHSITKMSVFHFTATEKYKKRVIQLGENPENVFCLGALGPENCQKINFDNVPEYVLDLPQKEYFVVLFHPETLTDASPLKQTNQLLEAISQFPQYKFVFIGSNADTNSNIIRDRIQKYVSRSENTSYFENLHSDAYHALLKGSVCLIGNSSSGIIEAPSLDIYTVNIGDRQKGRVRGNSVIDVPCKKDNITEAINFVLSKYKTVKPENPYYKENAAEQYFNTTLDILQKLKEDTKPKVFYDLK